ncbi:MAG: 2-oxo acid dehydrogenase subunit E2 [Candidatus Omnitrophica bacterium]|nr:2-oxo acid dehydrogenase subunit E2 [Candidatus Omnitrophota bacterium]
MIKEIIMPKLGETMEEGYIVSWKKNEGDKVEKGDVLFEVMSDKTNFEVEALHDGYLIRKLYEPSEEPIPVTTVIGYTSDNPEEKAPDAATAAEALKPEVKKEEPQAEGGIPPSPKEGESEMTGRVKASPLAKKTAQEAGIDISLVAGSGPGGRIEKKDVLEYMEAKGVQGKAAESAEYTIHEWTPLRKIIAKRLAESKREIPHYYFQGKFISDGIVNIREQKKKQGVELTYTDFLIFTAARAIKEYPLINARLINGEIRVYQAVGIGLAVSVEQGLVVPVLRDCEKKDIAQISEERKRIVEKARANRLSEEDMKNAGFVISNLGMYGVENFQPIISPPGTAIMGVGKLGKEMAVIGDKPEVKWITSVSFSFDHRVIDGSYAGLFYKRFKELFENPAII